MIAVAVDASHNGHIRRRCGETGDPRTCPHPLRRSLGLPRASLLSGTPKNARLLGHSSKDCEKAAEAQGIVLRRDVQAV